MTCANGSQSQLLVDSALPFDASSEIYDFLYETMAKHGRIVGGEGISGTRSKHVERTRLGTYSVGGRLSFEACPLDLDKWLPRILGTAEVANVFTLAETIPEFYVLINKVGGVFRYDSCKVNRAVFRSAAGPGDSDPELVEMFLEIMCKDEDPDQSWPASPPTLILTAPRAPYIFSEGVLTVNADDWPIKNFVLVIDNHLEPRWVNSVTATDLCPQDRTIRLLTTNPFTSTEFTGLYDLTAAANGVAATLLFTMGIYSTRFAMAGLQWADNSPVVRGKVEIPLTLDFQARMKGTDRELVVTNISS